MGKVKEPLFGGYKKERTGLIILLSLLLLLVFLWRMLPVLVAPPLTRDDEKTAAAWALFKQENMKEIPPADKHRSILAADTAANGADTASPPDPRLRPFDPNTASESTLRSLGLTGATVHILLHYRDKGGRFYRKEDLKKIYTLSPEDYDRLAPYVRIGTASAPGSRGAAESATAPAQLDLNKADSATLTLLPGIGPAYAHRIVAFRSALGGFVSVSQLREVYGFPDSTFRSLKDRFVVHAGDVRKINVNTADESTLYRHPYIRKQAGNIIRLRKRLGKIADMAVLQRACFSNEEKYRKIAPYLTLE